MIIRRWLKKHGWDAVKKPVVEETAHLVVTYFVSKRSIYQHSRLALSPDLSNEDSVEIFKLFTVLIECQPYYLESDEQRRENPFHCELRLRHVSKNEDYPPIISVTRPLKSSVPTSTVWPLQNLLSETFNIGIDSGMHELSNLHHLSLKSKLPTIYHFAIVAKHCLNWFLRTFSTSNVIDSIPCRIKGDHS